MPPTTSRPAIEDCSLDDVSAIHELMLDVCDEHSEVRVGGPRVHL
jgi:hypothetical protein